MQRCPKCLSDYLTDKGLIPVSIDYIKETGKPIKFGEVDLYVFV